MKRYLAIDLGASSGRHIVGHKGQDGSIVLEEVHRFATGMDQSENGLVWNVPRLFEEILFGIEKAFERYGEEIVSLSIDTWGVDYVLLEGDHDIPPYHAYRNDRNKAARTKVEGIVPFSKLYESSGIQGADFNTLYQLYADAMEGRLSQATDYLMLPSYFTYRLTGIKSHEYTNETTGGFIDAKTKTYDFGIIDSLSLPRRLFKQLSFPGENVGRLLPEIERRVGGNCSVILCASHDTASAFEAIDADEESVLLSSGTWSLIGIKSPLPILTPEAQKANFTNEGGVNYVRFLKNVPGLWINNQLRQELGLSQEDILSQIEESQYQERFDIDDPSLVAPKSMKKALDGALSSHPPKSNTDYFVSIYRSMGLAYDHAIKELETITGKTYSSVTVFGGGAKNVYLNRMIEAYTGKKVIALPIEATAIGNIKIQMEAIKP